MRTGRLTEPQREVMEEVADLLKINPRLARRGFRASDVFPARNNRDRARREVLHRLAGKGYFEYMDELRSVMRPTEAFYAWERKRRQRAPKGETMPWKRRIGTVVIEVHKGEMEKKVVIRPRRGEGGVSVTQAFHLDRIINVLKAARRYLWGGEEGTSCNGPIVHPTFSRNFNGYGGLVEAWPGWRRRPPRVDVRGLMVTRRQGATDDPVVTIYLDELPGLIEALTEAGERLGIEGIRREEVR